MKLPSIDYKKLVRTYYSVFIILIILICFAEIYLYPLFLGIIKPSGEAQIDEIVTQVSMEKDTFKKIETIVSWEAKNFTYVYDRTPDFLLRGYPIYFNSGIKVRAMLPLIPELSNNPQWIAYFKVGGCGELAYLFDEVARRSGIESRIVGTRGEDHLWNEAKIDEQWITIDPTIYFNNYYSNRTDIWFNNSKFYEQNWFNLSKVLVINTNEDVTRKYTDTGILKVFFAEPSDRVIVKATKNGKLLYVWAAELNSSKLEIELGGKNYTVIAEKNIIPYLISLKETKELEMIEGNNVTIQLSPYKLSLSSYFI
jgi:hypothetical protein